MAHACEQEQLALDQGWERGEGMPKFPPPPQGAAAPFPLVHHPKIHPEFMQCEEKGAGGREPRTLTGWQLI